MANIWEGTDYNITKIEVRTDFVQLDASNNLVDEGTSVELDYDYLVTLQRLPQNLYPHNTYVYINRIDYFSNLLPYPSTSESLVSDILPIINTAIIAFDASYDGSSPSTPNKTGFVTKIL